MQAQLHWSLSLVWPDTSALPYDGCLQSWTGSLEPLCPRPSGCRTPGFYEVVVRPFPQLHPRAGDLQEKAMSWEPPGKRHWRDVAGRFGGWWGQQARWPRARGCWSRRCSECSVSWILAAVSPGPSLATVLAPRRQGEGGMLTSEYNMFPKHVC